MRTIITLGAGLFARELHKGNNVSLQNHHPILKTKLEFFLLQYTWTLYHTQIGAKRDHKFDIRIMIPKK